MLNGIDTSDFQTDNAITACGRQDFQIVQASFGVGYVCKDHDHQVSVARSEGRLVGHYDFAYPLNTPETEAAWFLKSAKPRAGDWLCLDLERQDSSTWLTRLDFALRWGRFIRRETEASPVLYSFPNYFKGLLGAATPDAAAELRTMVLWTATAGMPANDPGDIYGWDVWTVHQYAAGPYADRNVLNGDVTTWHKIAIPGAKKPDPPKPPPAPPKPPAPAKLVEDGAFGEKSMRALQEYAHTPTDGVMTGQPETNRTFAPNLLAVQWVPDVEAKGSRVAVWVQERCHAHPDGKWGPLTTEALQRHLHCTPDGVFGPHTARALQHAINTKTL